MPEVTVRTGQQTEMTTSYSAGEHEVRALLDNGQKEAEAAREAEVVQNLKDGGVHVQDEDDLWTKKRETWSKKREYILTLMGYIVGIGNIWRFPYMCNRNGGGAFLIPFLLCLTFVGFPIFFLESALGQFSSRGPIHVWALSPLFKGVGTAMCIMSAINFWYFNTIMSWSLYYLVSCFNTVLPWARCDQWWNTPHCTDYSVASVNGSAGNITFSYAENATSYNVTSSLQSNWSTWMNNTAQSGWSNASLEINLTTNGNITDPLKMKVVTAAEEFWQHNVLQVSGGMYEPGHLVWYLVLAQCAVMLTIFLTLLKGIKSAGKVVYVTATAPYILLTVLLVRGVTLPGAKEGILFYLTPDFSRLLETKVWVEAALQVFFSLGPAWGVVITLSSYNNFDNNCLRDSFILSFLGEGTSVFGGFAIFSILGHMAYRTGVSVDKVVSSGPGLAFIAYPESLSLLPLPHMWSVLFFIMVVTLVVDSQLASIETVLTAMCDSFPRTLGRRRLLVTGVVCLVFLVTSLALLTQGGIYVFQLFDWFVGAVTLTVAAFIECFVVAWVYGANRFEEDIEMMIGRKPPMLIKIMWAFILPVLLVVLLVVTLVRYEPPVYGDYQYDGFGRALGWVIALVSFVPIPAVAIYTLATSEGSLWQRVKKTVKPSAKWGPADSARWQVYRSHLHQRRPRRHVLDILH